MAGCEEGVSPQSEPIKIGFSGSAFSSTSGEGVSPQSEKIKIGFSGSAVSSTFGAEALERQLQNLSLEENGGGNLESDTAVYTDKEDRKPHFPLRPGEPDCAFYLRTGACKYGSSCKFNHPPRKKIQEKGKEYDRTKETGEVPENSAQVECKYYLTAGGCKYGKSCRYSHLGDKTGDEDSVEYNFLGLPIRLGEKECPFYMQHGSCKFGINCRFHHPDPTAVDSTSGSQNGRSIPLQTSTMLGPLQSTSNEMLPQFLDAQPRTYVSSMLSPPYAVPSNQDWNSYQAPASPLLPHEWTLRLSSPPIGASSGKDATAVVDSSPLLRQNTGEEFPERPGEPECQYYMKTGHCKFRHACRFHHPKSRPSKSLPCVLSPMGLPLRPDQVICTYYSRFGICKYGPSCRFDHPMVHGSSSSSIASSSGKSASFPPTNEDSEPADGNTNQNAIQSTGPKHLKGVNFAVVCEMVQKSRNSLYCVEYGLLIDKSNTVNAGISSMALQLMASCKQPNKWGREGRFIGPAFLWLRFQKKLPGASLGFLSSDALCFDKGSEELAKNAG
ncbi:hypothetical protein H6P81_012459 [Aristolochia fimbriata]|uniref:C3H1-type domain-containing protein n=1 Tax=Aristolochia fimbriata TaxID=158543 RepID=A0AAV7ED59_ARIFI|nr:hypothetical protein H6P81_012459 [Aristolochia fimbriata]